MQKPINIACQICSNMVFEQIKPVLERAGFSFERFLSDSAMLRAIRRQNFDFILCELGDTRQLRDQVFSWLTVRSGDSTPVMVLTAMHNGETSAEALNAGADDVVSIPAEPVELIARIRAIYRRTNKRQVRRIIELAGYTLDHEACSLCYDNAPLELTPREFTMAWLLFSSPGEYISRETISKAIWGTDSDIAGRTIEQHVYKLRKKLHLGPERNLIIRTAYNQGYRLEVSAELVA